jgi:pilus assembly protein CpaB
MKAKTTLLFFLAALILAAVAAFGTRVYINKKAAQAAAKTIATKELVVAAVAVQPGEELKANQLTTQKWPHDAVPKQYYKSRKALIGRVAPNGLLKGEPITKSKLLPAGAESGLAAVLPPGMRAVTVQVDDVIGVAGYVKRGDRVDVLATASGAAFSKNPAAKVILQDVEILKINRNPEKEESKKRSTKKTQVVTLALNLEQTERLALTSNEGRLLLALRNQTDRAKVSTKGVLLTSLFPNPLPPEPKPAPKSRAGAAKKSPAPKAEEPMVEIIRGASRSRQVLN